MSEIYLESEHNFHFSAEGAVTAKALADNLLGLEGIFKQGMKVLSEASGVTIKDGQVLVEEIRLGSYKDNLVFRFVFGEGEEGEKKLEQFRKALKLDEMTPKGIGIFALSAVMLWGAWQLIGPDSPEAPPATVIKIENSFNNMGRDVGMTKEELIDVIDEAVTDKEGLKRSVVKFLKPDGKDVGGTLTLDGDEDLTIPADVISQVPVKYVKPEPDDPEKDFDDVKLVVRALDLDRPGTGWAGICPEVSDKRLPITLDEGLDPHTIKSGKYIDVDLTVIYKVDAHGNKSPKKIVLRAVR